MKKKFSLIFKIILSVILLAYLFKTIPLEKIFNSFLSADLILALTGIILALPINYFSALETQYLTRIQGMKLSVMEILRIHITTNFYGLFLPGTLSGGAIKWYKLLKHGDKSSAAAVVVFNRFLEVFITVLIGIVCFIPELISSGNQKIFFLWMFLFLILSSIYFLLLNKQSSNFVKKIILLLPIPKFIKDKISKIISAMYQFRNLRLKDHLEIFGLLLLYHGIGIISFYCFALSLDIHVTPWIIGWVRSVMTIAIMLPFSFAGLGIREATLVVLLGQYGVKPESSIALSFLFFSRYLISSLIGGLFELLPEKEKIVHKTEEIKVN